MDIESFRIYLRKYSYRKILIQKEARPEINPANGVKDSKAVRTGNGSDKEGRESNRVTR